MLMASNSSKMSPSSFDFNVSPNIHNRVQIWTLSRPNMSLMDLFSSHFLVVSVICADCLVEK